MTATATSGGTVQAGTRRWPALIVISVAQLMVAVDSTIVNIALPSAQKALGISTANRQWVLTAYLLAFGGLLLLGGRIADMAGRKRAFVAGVTGFTAASVLGGAAVGAPMLITARAVQGASAALMAPAGLALLAVTFTSTRERARALGIFSAIAGSGAAVGLIAGGALTEYLNWRWSLLVNAPFGLAVLAGAVVTVRDTGHDRGSRTRADIAGSALITGALMALIAGFTRAGAAGWAAPSTLALFTAFPVLLCGFMLAERRAAAPLLPLRVVADRNRAGVYLSQGLSVMTMFGLLLFLTYYLQSAERYSALKAGAAFLPLVAGMLAGASLIADRLIGRIAPRWLMAPGCLIAAAGMLLLTQLRPGASYLALIMPAEALFGLGLGLAFTPAMNLATHGVAPGDAGVASGMINASQQIGGAVGAALLNTVAASATAAWLTSHPRSPVTEATVRGYAAGAWWAAGILILAAAVVSVTVTARHPGQQGR